MSIKNTLDGVIVNDKLEIEHGVIYCGAGPHITIRDIEENHEIQLWTKQEVEQVKKMCDSFLNHIDTWDWVAKDKED